MTKLVNSVTSFKVLLRLVFVIFNLIPLSQCEPHLLSCSLNGCRRMEALAALGLASNVLQCIDFVSRLISEGSEIYTSLSGASQKTIELEKIYQNLSDVSSKLQSEESVLPLGDMSSFRSSFTQQLGSSELAKLKSKAHVKAINELTTDCQHLCDQLLDTIRKLQVRTGSHHTFKSFKAALKTVWSSKKIDDLQNRIDRFYGVISLHFFPILR
jgi:hypothetical protein